MSERGRKENANKSEQLGIHGKSIGPPARPAVHIRTEAPPQPTQSINLVKTVTPVAQKPFRRTFVYGPIPKTGDIGVYMVDAKPARDRSTNKNN